MKDIIEEKYDKQEPIIECLDHGFVKLVDCMPRLIPDSEDSADFAIAEAARCSYKEGTKKINSDEGLIRYLMRHSHTTPFEHIEFKFHCKLPIFVAREMIRHRTANVNEMSGRYSEMPKEYYIPTIDNIRIQSKNNNQGSEGYISGKVAERCVLDFKYNSEESFETYHGLLYSTDIVREQARIVLPLNTYTEWYWKIDLHNLLHFLALRCDEHAQQEMRVFADAILELITPIVPITVCAWNDYHPMRGGITLTRLEVEVIKDFCDNGFKKIKDIDSKNKREIKEWEDKAEKLGL